MPIKREEAEIWLEHPVTRDYLARLSSAIEFERSKITNLECLAPDANGNPPSAEIIARRLYEHEGIICGLDQASNFKHIIKLLLKDIDFLESREREYESYSVAQNLIETAVTNEEKEEEDD